MIVKFLEKIDGTACTLPLTLTAASESPRPDVQLAARHAEKGHRTPPWRVPTFKWLNYISSHTVYRLCQGHESNPGDPGLGSDTLGCKWLLFRMEGGAWYDFPICQSACPTPSQSSPASCTSTFGSLATSSLSDPFVPISPFHISFRHSRQYRRSHQTVYKILSK